MRVIGDRFLWLDQKTSPTPLIAGYEGAMPNIIDVCQVMVVDQGSVERAQNNMRSDKTLYELAETFKVLGDATRVRILHALSLEELCVCDIATLVNASQSAISHQLRLLRTAKLVKFRKEGKMAYYSLDDDHIRNLFEEGIRHVDEG
jgi:DNA-binding transcriptional ArsR family regulator